MAKQKDVFDQFMVFSVTQSGVDALTFGEIALGMSIFDYAALIISRIEYVPSRSAGFGKHNLDGLDRLISIVNPIQT